MDDIGQAWAGESAIAANTGLTLSPNYVRPVASMHQVRGPGRPINACWPKVARHRLRSWCGHDSDRGPPPFLAKGP